MAVAVDFLAETFDVAFKKCAARGNGGRMGFLHRDDFHDRGQILTPALGHQNVGHIFGYILRVGQHAGEVAAGEILVRVVTHTHSLGQEKRVG